VLEVGSGSKFHLFLHFHIVKPSSGSTKELGSTSLGIKASLVEASIVNDIQEQKSKLEKELSSKG